MISTLLVLSVAVWHGVQTGAYPPDSSPGWTPVGGESAPKVEGKHAPT